MKFKWLTTNVPVIYPENQHTFNTVGVTHRPEIDRLQSDDLDQGCDDGLGLGTIADSWYRYRATGGLRVKHGSPVQCIKSFHDIGIRCPSLIELSIRRFDA